MPHFVAVTISKGGLKLEKAVPIVQIKLLWTPGLSACRHGYGIDCSTPQLPWARK